MNISFESMASKLELHYFLKDQSHSMDAVLRNKCEYELLNIFKEVANRLDIRIEIESEALDKGGIKEIWNFIGENSNQLTLIILAITLILSRIPATNQSLDKLRETELNLSIEEKRLNIERLKKEVNSKPYGDIDTEELIEIINDYLKIRKHKSNFYSQLLPYSKISKIGTRGLDDKNIEVIPEKVVERKDFYKFILQTDELSAELDDNAVIEIISPVLKPGNYKWKGLYEKEAITFYMKDKDFKNSVLIDGLKFKNGTIIECVLEKSRKIDNIGDIIISGYSVTTVIKKVDDSEVFNTLQGAKYKRIQKEKKRQYKMFENNDQ